QLDRSCERGCRASDSQIVPAVVDLTRGCGPTAIECLIERDAELGDRGAGLRNGSHLDVVPGDETGLQCRRGVDPGIEEFHLLDEVSARIDGRALEVVHVIAVDDSPSGRDQLALMVPMASSACCLP